MSRVGNIERSTSETDIKLTLDLDGSGKYNVKTGVRFFDHMLELFAKHGRFNLDLTCNGDVDIDTHHTVEDIGICLGQAIKESLGDKNKLLDMRRHLHQWTKLCAEHP